MCGLMVDAYKLRKKTEDFDVLLEAIFSQNPGVRNDFKTSRFINGKGCWRDIEAQVRKDLLTNICKLSVENGGKVIGVGLSFQRFDNACTAGHGHTVGNSYWLGAAMFTCCLIQKKMQGVRENKGLTVVIMDDNKQEMPRLSDALYESASWFDGLYQLQEEKRGKKDWAKRSKDDRFDQIVNTAFAIKSDHSSLVQVADAISYVYRRHLELQTATEAWTGEKQYYRGLVKILEPSRQTIGRCPDTPCVSFFKDAKHKDWKL
jgi:hypothetical protein